jgi:hypothetical protein
MKAFTMLVAISSIAAAPVAALPVPCSNLPQPLRLPSQLWWSGSRELFA